MLVGAAPTTLVGGSPTSKVGTAPTSLVGAAPSLHAGVLVYAGFVKKLQGFSLQEGKSGGFYFQIRRSCGNESCLVLHPLPKKVKSV